MTNAQSKQLFAALPLRAIAEDLSGLQLRVLACVAAHDRMSLVTGKGQGCRASNERMRKMVGQKFGCNYERLCATLSELVELRLLTRDKFQAPGQRGWQTVYRVIYTDDDRALFDMVSRRARWQTANRNETDQLAIGHVMGPIVQLAERQVDDAGPTCQTASKSTSDQLAERLGPTCADPPKMCGNPSESGNNIFRETDGKNSTASSRLDMPSASKGESAGNVGGKLVKFRREPARHCDNCSQGFEPKTWNQRYCSVHCCELSSKRKWEAKHPGIEFPWKIGARNSTPTGRVVAPQLIGSTTKEIGHESDA